MPITVTAARSALSPDGQRQVLPLLSAALVEISGLQGNPFFESIVGGTVHLLPDADVYAGGRPRPLIMVELKLPNIGLADTASRARFITRATDIVAALASPGHRREDIWVNILNAPDGGWGIGGTPYTGDALYAAVIGDRV
jgi:phenylpyruvate tautomerase PptA (4-oxalocrotonate tautomerase family)